MAFMLEDQDFNDMNFLFENHAWSPSNSHNSHACKENTQSQNQKNENDETLRDLNNVTSAEGRGVKVRESADHEMHILTERERRRRMRNMFTSLHALLPHLPSKADKSTIVDETVSYIKSLQETLEQLEKQKQERIQCGSTFGFESSSSPMFLGAQGFSSNNNFAQGFSSNNNFSNTIMGASSNTIMGTSSNTIMGTSSNALLFPAPQPVAFDKTWASSNMVLNVCGNEAQFCICSAHKPGLMTNIAFVLDKYKIELVSANISSTGNGNATMIQVHGKQASEFLDANSVEEIFRQAAGEIMLWIA